MALFFKKDHDYVSPLDRCLQAFRRTATTTLAQQREIDKASNINKKMSETTTKNQDLDKIWQDF